MTGGDVITIDGTAVTSNDDLSTFVTEHKPGDRVKVTLVRGSQTITLQVTLGARPSVF